MALEFSQWITSTTFLSYFSTWLAKNLRTAHERLAALRPIEEHIEVLKRRLVEEFGVKDVRWQNSWGLVQYRACLLSLLRLCERHGVDNLHLRGQWGEWWWLKASMMTSSNGNIFCITGPVWGESTGNRWIPLTEASDVGLWCFLWFAPESTAKQTVQMLVTWDPMALIVRSLYWDCNISTVTTVFLTTAHRPLMCGWWSLSIIVE